MNFLTGIIPESRAPLKTSFLRHHNGVGAFVAGDRNVPAPVGFGVLMVSRGSPGGHFLLEITTHSLRVSHQSMRRGHSVG